MAIIDYMNLLYVKRFFRGFFNPKIKSIEVYGINKSSKQLYRLHIKCYGAYRIRINDFKVNWREAYVCGFYQKNTIKIEVKGLFKSITHYEPVDIIAMVVNVSALRFLEKHRPLSAQLDRQDSYLHIKDLKLLNDLTLKLVHKYKLNKRTNSFINKNIKLTDRNYLLTNLKK